ncbi:MULTISPECIES: hypothetical protein [Streptomyces]|nr:MULTISPECIES: hypothetical protein [Streptomyces]
MGGTQVGLHQLEAFKELLTEAGLDDRRLYDGSRHTAGTILNGN